jgi:hypothetical protein
MLRSKVGIHTLYDLLGRDGFGRRELSGERTGHATSEQFEPGMYRQ